MSQGLQETGYVGMGRNPGGDGDERSVAAGLDGGKLASQVRQAVRTSP